MERIFHSVLLITYNQEEYIEEAITSVLNQTQLPEELIILDDCSTDKNWEIITSYSNKHPNLIIAHRNENNIGLIESLNKIRQLYNGNVISFLAGDDKLGPNAILSINETIIKNNYNPEIDPFIIITNSAHLHHNGKYTLWDNFRERHISAIKTRLRYGLSYRGVGFSSALLQQCPSEAYFFNKYPEIGYSADLLKGFEEVIYSKYLKYINVVGSVYRLNVGVTSYDRIKEKKKWTTHRAVYSIVAERYATYFDKSDRLFVKFILSGDLFKIEPSIKNWLFTVYYFVLNIGNFSYNNPAVRNLHYILPNSVKEYLKLHVYPHYLAFREYFTKAKNYII